MRLHAIRSAGVIALMSGLGLACWLLYPSALWVWRFLSTMEMGWLVWSVPIVGGPTLAVAAYYQLRAHGPPALFTRKGDAMANIEQYKNWCTQQIGKLVLDQQLHCQASVLRGPFSLVYTLRITRDPAGGLRKLLTLGPTLQMLMRTNVRIMQAPAGVMVEVELPRQAHITPNAAKLAMACRWPEIPLGIDQHMAPISVNPETHGALYWVAPPRSGKTQSMRATLYLMRRAAVDLRFLVCALPAKIQKDWGTFGRIEGCLGMVSDFAEMEQALAWVVSQMNSGAHEGKTVVILDDLTSLMVHAPAISPYIDALSLTGPGLGYHLLVGTHGAGSISTTGGKMAQFAMTCKVLFKAADNLTGARSSGRKNTETGLAQLSGAPGDAILDENGRITRIATAWIRDYDILSLPAAGASSSRPWSQDAVTGHGLSQPSSQPLSRGVTSGSHGLSQLSQGVTPPHANGSAMGNGGGVRDGVTSVTTVTRDNLLAEVGDIFPVEPERAMNQTEDAWLRHLMDSGLFSESALADVAYGQRNKRRLGLVRESLARTADSATTEQSVTPTVSRETTLTAAEAVAILEGDPEHPLRKEAMRIFNLTSEVIYE